MEEVILKVEGMSCTNCALSIDKYLRNQGMGNVRVNFIGGDVSFNLNGEGKTKEQLEKGIESLGYKVKKPASHSHDHHGYDHDESGKFHFHTHLQRFWFCFVFTLPLMIHMIPGIHIHLLMNPYFQLFMTIPVYIVGMDFFGRSAIKSILHGIPNMNVLIAFAITFFSSRIHLW